MKWKNSWLGLVVIGLLLAGAAPARADCVKTGKVVGSGFDLTTNPHSAWFNLGSGAHPTFVYQYTTTDPGVIADLSDAQLGNQTVEITGDAATCPTVGAVRSGGKIIKVKRFRLK